MTIINYINNDNNNNNNKLIIHIKTIIHFYHRVISVPSYQ